MLHAPPAKVVVALSIFRAKLEDHGWRTTIMATIACLSPDFVRRSHRKFFHGRQENVYHDGKATSMLSTLRRSIDNIRDGDDALRALPVAAPARAGVRVRRDGHKLAELTRRNVFL